MFKATHDFLTAHEHYCQARKTEILNSADEVRISGCTYYVSNDGDDTNTGLSPASPWKTLGYPHKAISHDQAAALSSPALPSCLPKACSVTEGLYEFQNPILLPCFGDLCFDKNLQTLFRRLHPAPKKQTPT
jgi:hypothetical protein